MLLSQDFVETKLATKFSEFLIRVYPNSYGKETFALHTKNLDTTKPVLVRVHSECITGDMLGSLHCDCGEQLHKSLAMISKEGGVLIYLRQEGRGIGLFEKIKTYQLQSKGVDTFEANVLLGHQPDQRSYEMVKIVLDDLHIPRIRLLTNNPSKISEITKFGIEIVERVPVLSKPNKHNKQYLETKKAKFQHFLNRPESPYFYQFNVDKADFLPSIIDFVKQKKKDPLLKIGIAISANHHSLHDPIEKERIEHIIRTCTFEPDFLPVLHFSFVHSPNALEDLDQIQAIWPSLKRLQLNDLPTLDLNLLQKAAEKFQLDIPLSEETFSIVHQESFRDFIKKYQCFLLLDNSKGRGVRQTKEHFLEKINVLLGYGLNDLFLCGGFGPDHLDTYFELRRHYRINFSIDAESHLKTQGAIDPEKVKIYLFHLLRFDYPKQ
ncbi:MAG: GTP cyclohydrolase II, partial [Chlamydiales bacterium]|nr:GTP cyclohydrolase II [Chlamydiales bacterium]